MVDATLFGFSAILMAFTNTVAAAVASMFMAVPTRVWSALKLMAATARRSENTIPNTTLPITTPITMAAGERFGMYFMTSAPPRAPATMIPSSPRLMIPLRSEKQPPSATSSNTDA